MTTNVYFFDAVDWCCLPQLLAVNTGQKQYRLRFLHTGFTDETQRREERVYKPHRHDVYHIILYRSGTGVIPIEGTFQAVTPDRLVITNPGQSHHFYPRSKSEFSYWEITFCYESRNGTFLRLPLEDLIGMLCGYSSARKRLICDLEKSSAKRIQNLLSRLSYVADHSNEHEIFAPYLILVDLLGILVEQIFEKQATCSTEQADTVVNNIRQELENGYACRPNLKQLAAANGLSLRQLQRRFKTNIGQSPLGYWNYCRIRLASQLLREQGLRVKEVADRLGFSSPYHFSRVFKKQTGVPPGKYR